MVVFQSPLPGGKQRLRWVLLVVDSTPKLPIMSQGVASLGRCKASGVGVCHRCSCVHTRGLHPWPTPVPGWLPTSRAKVAAKQLVSGTLNGSDFPSAMTTRHPQS